MRYRVKETARRTPGYRDGDRRVSIEFCCWLWSDRGAGYAFFGALNRSSGQWFETAFHSGDLNYVGEFLTSRDPRQHDIYYCPNLFERPRRLGRFALPTKFAWRDIDAGDPRKFVPQPTVLVETSRGRHQGLWLFKGAVDPRTAEAVSKMLAYRYGGDRNGWSVTKMLRLPGTINRKPEYDCPKVELVWNTREPYPNWPDASAIRQNNLSPPEIDPTRHDPDEVIRRYTPRLAPRFRHLMKDARVFSSDRSKMIFMIVVNLNEAGATPDEIASVVWRSPYFMAKHGNSLRRLNDEIFRILGKSARLS
jgi:RepB DNA-primase from phage plasmid